MISLLVNNTVLVNSGMIIKMKVLKCHHNLFPKNKRVSIIRSND